MCLFACWLELRSASSPKMLAGFNSNFNSELHFFLFFFYVLLGFGFGLCAWNPLFHASRTFCVARINLTAYKTHYVNDEANSDSTVVGMCECGGTCAVSKIYRWWDDGDIVSLECIISSLLWRGKDKGNPIIFLFSSLYPPIRKTAIMFHAITEKIIWDGKVFLVLWHFWHIMQWCHLFHNNIL